MQTWLLEKVGSSEAASAVEIPGMPSFVSKLTPEMQLQYYLKKEEQEKELELAQLKQEKELEFARLKQKEEFELTKLKLEEEERDKAREALHWN